MSERPTPARTGDNLIMLRGRLAAEAVLRTLPSGDELCAFRLTVARPPGERGRVDSIDCASTLSRVRRTVLRAEPGDLLEVSGSLRRRFWRSAGGLASRYEVLADSARLTVRRPVRRPSRPASDAAPARTRASG
jgi:single-strand DNA-binding protein